MLEAPAADRSYTTNPACQEADLAVMIPNVCDILSLRLEGTDFLPQCFPSLTVKL